MGTTEGPAGQGAMDRREGRPVRWVMLGFRARNRGVFPLKSAKQNRATRLLAWKIGTIYVILVLAHLPLLWTDTPHMAFIMFAIAVFATAPALSLVVIITRFAAEVSE